jgi:membrane associated rhomboid family serine protease
LALATEADVNRFFHDYGVVPNQLNAWWNDPSGVEEPATLITAAFLHGSWLHLGGNMLYLWVFGDNIEDALGHIGYALFYAIGAIAAALTQFAVDTGSTVPMIGASGAIAAVLGAYLVLYPRASVGVFFVIFILPVPAFVLIIFWFLMQLVSGFATLGDSQATETVAVWAHVGGFVAGFVIMLPLRPFVRRKSRRTPARVW